QSLSGAVTVQAAKTSPSLPTSCPSGWQSGGAIASCAPTPVWSDRTRSVLGCTRRRSDATRGPLRGVEPVDPLPRAAVELQLRGRLLPVRQAPQAGRRAGRGPAGPGPFRRLGRRPRGDVALDPVRPLGRGPLPALVSRGAGPAVEPAARRPGRDPDEPVLRL